MSYNANYPVSADVLANPTTLTNRDDAGFELHGVISRIQDILEALEAKVGIGSSTPPASAAVLRRTATGASGWGLLAAGDLAAGAIMNADVNAAALIAYSKLAALTAGVVKSTGSTLTGGNLIAGGDIQDGSVTSAKIFDGTIATADLGPSSFASGQTSGQITQIATIAVPGQNATGTAANNMTGGALSLTTQGGPVLLLYSSRGDFVASAASSTIQVWEGASPLMSILANGLSPTVSQSRTGHYLLLGATAATHTYQLAWFTDVAVQQNTGGATFTAIEFKR